MRDLTYSLFILLIYYLCSVPTSSSTCACQGKGEGAIFRGCGTWTWSCEESTSQNVNDAFTIASAVAATAQFPQAAAATALKISFSRQSRSSSSVLPSAQAQSQLWAATSTQSQQKPTSRSLIPSPQQQASQSLAHTHTHYHSASASASYGILRESRRHLLRWTLILNLCFPPLFSAGIRDATLMPCIQHPLHPLSCIQCVIRRHRAYTFWRRHFLHPRHHSGFVQEHHSQRDNMVIIHIHMRYRDSFLDQLEDLKLYIITNLFTQLLFTFVCVLGVCVCVCTLN